MLSSGTSTTTDGAYTFLVDVAKRKFSRSFFDRIIVEGRLRECERLCIALKPKSGLKGPPDDAFGMAGIDRPVDLLYR